MFDYVSDFLHSFYYLPLCVRWRLHNSIQENEEDNSNQDVQQDNLIRKARKADPHSKKS
jgi:hypothetical protein